MVPRRWPARVPAPEQWPARTPERRSRTQVTPCRTPRRPGRGERRSAGRPPAHAGPLGAGETAAEHQAPARAHRSWQALSWLLGLRWLRLAHTRPFHTGPGRPDRGIHAAQRFPNCTGGTGPLPTACFGRLFRLSRGRVLGVRYHARTAVEGRRGSGPRDPMHAGVAQHGLITGDRSEKP